MRFPSTIGGSAAVVVTAAVLAGCGGGSTNSTAAAGAPQAQQGQQQGRGPFAQLTASQRTCLQKAGLGGRRPGGQPPSSTDRASRFQKLQAAFKKCGIQMPSRPPGGAQPGAGGASN
jgi:hypothetical protein